MQNDMRRVSGCARIIGYTSITCIIYFYALFCNIYSFKFSKTLKCVLFGFMAMLNRLGV